MNAQLELTRAMAAQPELARAMAATFFFLSAAPQSFARAVEPRAQLKLAPAAAVVLSLAHLRYSP